MNENRAKWGESAVCVGTPDAAENDLRTNVADTLANIMHLCAREGVSYRVAGNAAEANFVAEQRGDDGDSDVSVAPDNLAAGHYFVGEDGLLRGPYPDTDSIESELGALQSNSEIVRMDKPPAPEGS